MTPAAALRGRQLAAGRQRGGHARRVVVGAVVNLPVLGGARQRVDPPVAQVVVVGAEHDVRLLDRHAAGRRQVAEHVVPDALRPIELHLDGGLQRQLEPGDVRVARIERRLHLLQRAAGALDDGRRQPAVHRGGHDAGIAHGRSLTAVSNVSATSSPALGERGPVTTIRPAAPRSRAASAL